MPYSDILLDHFHRPRNQRVLPAADACGIAGTPGNGNFLVIYLRCEEGRIIEATFQSHGCAPAIAAGSLLAERLAGSTFAEAAAWTEAKIHDALGGLPPHKRHCSALAAAALAAALEQCAARAAGRSGPSP